MILVPDGIEPIVGYRCWSYERTPDGVSLLPLSSFRFAPSELSVWAGAESRWVDARCLGMGALASRHANHLLRILGVDPEAVMAPSPHEAPMEHCSCGFYAMRNLVPALVATASEALVGAQIHVLGRVLLSGKVIEHAKGYRAARARIAELIPVKGTERTVASLAASLGLPIGTSV